MSAGGAKPRPAPPPPPMSPDDILVGFPLGNVSVPGRFSVGRRSDPREVIEHVVRRAVARPPCVVGFSGGRDSSAVLAVATAVARREGLPDPIPVTRVFPGVPDTDEHEWQELVVRHLGLREWIRDAIDDEMDLLGPLALERIRRHGVLWSPFQFGDEYYFRHAAGGSVLDGEGGDEVCGPEIHRIAPLAHMLRRRVPPNRRRMRRAARVLAPRRALRRRGEHRETQQLRPWLRPAAYELLAEQWKRHVAVEPLDARRSIRLVPQRRAVVGMRENQDYFAAQHGIVYLSPLLEPPVVEALAARAGHLGFRDRAEGLAAVAGDLLPPAVLTRRSKAAFNATFFNRYTREFAEAWSGAGVDPDLVDVEVLRDIWRSSADYALSACLLHAAWLGECVVAGPATG